LLATTDPRIIPSFCRSFLPALHASWTSSNISPPHGGGRRGPQAQRVRTTSSRKRRETGIVSRSTDKGLTSGLTGQAPTGNVTRHCDRPADRAEARRKSRRLRLDRKCLAQDRPRLSKIRFGLPICGRIAAWPKKGNAQAGESHWRPASETPVRLSGNSLSTAWQSVTRPVGSVPRTT